MTNENLHQVRDEPEHYSQPTISKVIEFLRMFMPVTIAKRIVCIVILSIGVPVEESSRICGFCQKTVSSIKKKLEANEIDALFVLRGGGGRRSPLADFKSAIVEEVNQNTYQTKQQIADMILEKYGIKVTPQAVGKLLKKTELDY